MKVDRSVNALKGGAGTRDIEGSVCEWMGRKATGWEGDTEREPSGWVCAVARWTDGMGTQMGEIERAGLLQGLTAKIGDGKGVLATKRVRKVPPRHLLVPLVCSAGCTESRLMESVWHFSRKWLRVRAYANLDTK